MSAAISISVLADVSKASKGINDINGKLDGLGKAAGRMGGALKAGLAIAAGALVGAKVVDFFGDAISSAQEYNKVSLQSANQIRNLGKQTDITVSWIQQNAAKLEGVSLIDEEEIIQGQSTLVKFGVSSTEVLTKAAQIAADYAVQTGKSYGDASEIIGKALAQPEKSFGKLAKAGIVLTKSQQEQVKAFVKAGNEAGAQGVILDALAQKTKGAADAQDPLAKAQFHLADAFGDFQRSVGQKLIPILAAVVGWLADKLPGALQFVSDLWEQARPTVALLAQVIGEKLVGAFRAVIGVVSAIVGWFQQNKDAAVALGVGVGVLVAGLIVYKTIVGVISLATKAWAAIQLAFNIIMAANPIYLVIIAIAALVAGVVYAYLHFETFRNIVNAVWSAVMTAIKAVVDWFMTSAWPIIRRVVDFVVAYFRLLFNITRAIWTAVYNAIRAVVDWFMNTAYPIIKRAIDFVVAYFQLLLRIAGAVWSGIYNAISRYIGAAIAVIQGIVGAAKAVWTGVSSWFGKIVGFVTGLPGKIASAASGMWDGITGAFKSAINGIIRAWNNLQLGPIGGQEIFGGTPLAFHLPSFTLSTPDIPYLAKGGIVTRPTLAVIGEAGPEAVVPLNGRGLGNTYQIYIDASLAADPHALGRTIVAAIQSHESLNGTGWRRPA